MSQYRKEQIIKKLMFTMFTLLFAGGILLILDYPNIKIHLFGPTEFESLEPDEIKDGLIVEILADINFGAYAYNEQKSFYYGYPYPITSKATDVYYVIWTGDAYAEDYRYMGIKVPVSEQDIMEEIAEAVSNGTHAEPVKYTGIINKMSSKEYPLFEAYFQEAGWSKEEIEKRTLPYTINVSFLEEGDNSVLYIFMGIFLVPAVLAVWCSEWKS